MLDTTSRTTRVLAAALALPIGLVMASRHLDVSPLLLYPVVLLLVAAGAVGSWWYARKRGEELRRFVATIGWSHVGSDPSLASRWRGAPFGRGHSPRVSEVIAGSYGGRSAVSFAYRFTTGSGKERQTHQFHVVAMAMPAWLPSVQLTPQGLGARIATAFGGEDLTFESDEFNRRWRVEARDPRFAHDVLHPRTLERLIRPDASGLSLRIEGSDVLSWTPGLPDVETLAARLGVMRALVDGVPRHVWLDHGFDPSRIPTVPERTW